MSPITIVLTILAYFAVLIGVSFFTKDDSNTAFFSGNKKSPWYIVAFGMIGASLSGVTFLSVPGWVKNSQFGYMQMVLGYFVGYLVIAYVLLPLYYRLNVTSIYSYLNQRFGVEAYKSGAVYFLISRTIGAAFRLYLVASVFQTAIFAKLDVEVPFVITVAITILLIWLYTFKSGIKTIIWTDTLQTAFMLIAVVLTLFQLSDAFDVSILSIADKVSTSSYSKVFFFEDWRAGNFFFKNFFAGMFITIAMTGLDQDMMQKNLSCKNLGDAKKNMLWFSVVLIFVNLLFLSLGALLYEYASLNSVDIESGDTLFSTIALDGYLGGITALFFILGLIAAAYSSADSALTALTTSFCVDLLGFESADEKGKEEKTYISSSLDTGLVKGNLERKQKRIRTYVHIGFSLLLLVVISFYKFLNNDSVIKELFKVAGYTYGPLLGMFSFGILSKRKVFAKLLPIVVLLSPLLTFLLNEFSEELFFGYKFGFELLIINGVITIFGLTLVSRRH